VSDELNRQIPDAYVSGISSKATMYNDKELKLLETLTLFTIGYVSKIIVKLSKRDPADRFLTNIILLHIFVLISMIFLSYLISMFVR
jgi:hypothetical protein